MDRRAQLEKQVRVLLSACVCMSLCVLSLVCVCEYMPPANLEARTKLMDCRAQLEKQVCVYARH